MSFTYGQFGTGFQRTRPPAQALRLRELLETRGRDITIIQLTEASTDAYGQPVHTDSSYTEKAFLSIKGQKRDLPPGAIKTGRIRLFMVPWAAMGEEGFEVEVDGVRYRVTVITETGAYLEVEGERKA
ncbi:MAG: hypothetical protein NWE88_09490 [Candidatus Bathyarchaeota archaeon]|nr:hypothetical protein [Candidatus Bathyarchaeota archaeon]